MKKVTLEVVPVRDPEDGPRTAHRSRAGLRGGASRPGRLGAVRASTFWPWWAWPCGGRKAVRYREVEGRLGAATEEHSLF